MFLNPLYITCEMSLFEKYNICNDINTYNNKVNVEKEVKLKYVLHNSWCLIFTNNIKKILDRNKR